MATRALAPSQSEAGFTSIEPGYTVDMYIGLGTLVVILLIVLIVYFVRRA